jgi:sterol desaturase/sphingolipid hydroxylase (fatty acid hydroxylase superfamily)
MTTGFFIGLVAIFVFDTILGGVLGWMARNEKYTRYRIHVGRNPIAEKKRTMSIALNYTIPQLMYGGFLYFLGNHILYKGLPSIPTLFGETIGVIMLYDFMYYFFHRAMHWPAGMKLIHGVHHRIRYATAEASTYLHPAEGIGGTALFLLSIVILGPISGTSFLIDFFLFSAINIYVHSNFVFPHPAFRLLNFWTRTHDVHHYYCRNNYSSIFPFWDQMFGTAEDQVVPAKKKTAPAAA